MIVIAFLQKRLIFVASLIHHGDLLTPQGTLDVGRSETDVETGDFILRHVQRRLLSNSSTSDNNDDGYGFPQKNFQLTILIVGLVLLVWFCIISFIVGILWRRSYRVREEIHPVSVDSKPVYTSITPLGDETPNLEHNHDLPNATILKSQDSNRLIMDDVDDFI
eukprot:gene1756-1868_t